MPWKRKALLGGIGALTPLILNLLVVDIATVLSGLEPLVVVGYAIRVGVLFFVGALWASLHKTETDPKKLFQLGIVAPAMIVGVINGLNARPGSGESSERRVAAAGDTCANLGTAAPTPVRTAAAAAAAGGPASSGSVAAGLPNLPVLAVSRLVLEVMQAESVRVRGTVTDSATGAPIAGAWIVALGTTATAVTGPAGTYQLTLPVGSQRVQVRAIGYRARFVDVGPERAALRIELAAAPIELGEIMVVAADSLVAQRRSPIEQLWRGILGRPEPASEWFVVTSTAATLAEARQQAQVVAQATEGRLRPQVLEGADRVNIGTAPYAVVVGGKLTYQEAQQVVSRAQSLPPDLRPRIVRARP
ncbi:MAG: carboxypeptidase-like regulatory domain-containing protein [Gemmatimonadetes bacterium]|nr:carboxypeptidase-like regulatory domain-containing protein [Gemmatimonadota bacterium]